MIKKIFRSKLDMYNLSIKRTASLEGGVNIDYRGRIVMKPWGYEYLMFENDCVAIWILYLKHECATSIHCHPNKKTSLNIISGDVFCSTLDNQFFLSKMDGLSIEKGVFHSTKALSEEGVIVMEIESPPNKVDLVRLKDKYGRENKVYEGEEHHICCNFEEYKYIDFHSINIGKGEKECKNIGDMEIKIVKDYVFNIYKHFDASKEASICFLNNTMINNVNSKAKVPIAGEMFNKEDLMNISKLGLDDMCMAMIIN